MFFGTFVNMAKYFLHLAYKGTHYHGWQIQPNSSSIQGVLQTCLSTFLREDISVVGCGRTDTGVHARNFYAHFESNNSVLEDSTNFIYKINNFLPKDIVIFKIYKMHSEAHSRFDAISRTYKYYLSEKKEIFLSDYCCQLKFNLNIDKMNQASNRLLKYVDFTSFSKLHTDVKTNNCKIKHAKWEFESEMLVFTITADRFLRNMVRAIVGTLIEVGKNKMGLNEFSQVIELQDRTEAGVSVPAKGLFLENVEYPYEFI